MIDLKTLVPWDKETVKALVIKTGRLLVSIHYTVYRIILNLFGITLHDELNVLCIG